MIVHDNVAIIRSRQTAIRREIDRRGIALKAVAFDSGIPYETLLTYFPIEGGREPAQIAGSAIYALCEGKSLPLDLLSLLLPEGFQIVRAPEAIDHDEIETIAREYLAQKGKAHHPLSPAGREISDCEDVTLRRCATQLKAVA